MAYRLRLGPVRLSLWAILVFAGHWFGAAAPSSVTAELPLQFRDGLLWTEVSATQSTEPLHFLVDTGASVSVMNLTTAKRLGLKLGTKARVTAVATNLTGYWPVKLPAHAGALRLPGEYLALDLGKLSGSCGRPVDGLIGADFFRNRVVEIDYAARTLRVLASSPPADATNAVPLESHAHGFRVSVNVNGGESQPVRLDTGCATAFQWVTSKEHAGRDTRKFAVGLTDLSIPQTMTGVRIGARFLDTVPTGLHSKVIFPGESGLLGNGLLAQFGVVTLDTRSGRLFLGPTPLR